MSQQPGLRFDIYERILLPDGAESIRELDGVELFPHIQVDVEGEQAIVRGHLLLEGTYGVEDESRSTVALEHLIPVEITLPMNRVSSVEEISVQIDNFDVDLLSPRSLNVTGVLSLHGIEVYSGTANGWREEEEIIFVHNAEQDDQEEEAADETYAQPAAAPWIQAPAAVYQQRNDYAPIAAHVPSFESSEVELEPREEYTEAAEEAEIEAEAYEEEDPQDEQQAYASIAAQPAVYQPFTIQTPEPVVASAPKPREEIDEDTYEDLTLLDYYETDSEDDSSDSDTWTNASSSGSEDEEEREKEMKIAFISKKSEESQSLDFKNYIHKNEAHRKSDNDREAGSAGNAKTTSTVEETGPADVLEWKKLFLSETEEQKFKKVRMVIVQKQETLETIAKRYDRKPQEIKLYNRLQELDISAGQVIYIP